MFFIFSCAKEQMDTDSAMLEQAKLITNAGPDINKSGPDKVDICHYSEEDGTWHVINVSVNALPAHLGHGDVLLVDADGDGWVAAENECVPGGDCDDDNPDVNPGVEEICGNEVDDNCNGEVDESCFTCPCYTYEEALAKAATATQWFDEDCFTYSIGYFDAPFNWGVENNPTPGLTFCVDFNGNFNYITPEEGNQCAALLRAVQAIVQRPECGGNLIPDSSPFGSESK